MSQTPEAPVEALPNSLSELDKLRVQLATERQQRIALQSNALNAEIARARGEDAELMRAIRERYALIEGDEILDTGAIKRAARS